MAQSLIPPPSKMDMRGNIASNFKYFKSSWTNYCVATAIVDKAAVVQVATLLTIMGKECYEVYENLPITDEERKDPKKILDKLGEHFEPRRNTIYERYMFNSSTQDTTESIEQYVNRLRKLSSTCEYGVLLDEMLRDRIVIGVHDSHIRARLLREKDLTLQRAYDVCRSCEAAATQVKTLNTEAVSYVSSKTKKKHQVGTDKACKYCGNEHARGQCPAYGKTCAKCSKINHFAKVCKSTSSKSTTEKPQYKQKKKYAGYRQPQKSVHQLDTNEDELSSSESIYSVQLDENKRQYFVKLQVKPEKNSASVSTIRLQLDSGASCSTMRLEDYQSITSQPLQSSNTTLKLYDQTVMRPVGATTMYCTAEGVTKKNPL